MTMTWSRHSRRSVPTSRSAIAFACGVAIGVSTVSMPMPRVRTMKSRPYDRSRSRIRKRGSSPHGVASISWRHTHSAFGWSVTLKKTIGPRP